MVPELTAELSVQPPSEVTAVEVALRLPKVKPAGKVVVMVPALAKAVVVVSPTVQFAEAPATVVDGVNETLVGAVAAAVMLTDVVRAGLSLVVRTPTVKEPTVEGLVTPVMRRLAVELTPIEQPLVRVIVTLGLVPPTVGVQVPKPLSNVTVGVDGMEKPAWNCTVMTSPAVRLPPELVVKPTVHATPVAETTCELPVAVTLVTLAA